MQKKPQKKSTTLFMARRLTEVCGTPNPWGDPTFLCYLYLAAAGEGGKERKKGGTVGEWLVCWTQAQKGLGSNPSRDAVGS